MESRQRKCRNCLSPDNIIVAPKGNIKIGLLCWLFGYWNRCLHCESRSWASASVDTDCSIFTQKLRRGGKVGVALSQLCVVMGVSWFLSHVLQFRVLGKHSGVNLG